MNTYKVAVPYTVDCESPRDAVFMAHKSLLAGDFPETMVIMPDENNLGQTLVVQDILRDKLGEALLQYTVGPRGKELEDVGNLPPDTDKAIDRIRSYYGFDKPVPRAEAG